jgi:hypothetical protein
MAVIPEIIDFAEARAIQTDENHPLRGEYCAGNPALVEKMDQAFQRHHGREGGRTVEIPIQDAIERDLKERFPEGTAEPETDSEAYEQHFRDYFGAEAQEAAKVIHETLSTIPKLMQDRLDQKYPDILKDVQVLEFLYALGKKKGR